MFLARFHALPRAHRSCLEVSSWRSVLKFHSVGTFADEEILTCILQSDGPQHDAA